MIKIAFIISAALYWLATLSRTWFAYKNNDRWLVRVSLLEKFNFLIFTAGIVLYIYSINTRGDILFAESMISKRPLSWLLFAWALNAANILTEIAYNNRETALFSSVWTALALSLLPNISTKKIAAVFSNDMNWLHIHRLSYLLGYAFCMLALPVTIRWLVGSLRYKYLLTDQKKQEERKRLLRMDRMQYRMILWSLPLLTLGIIAEALYMLEQNQFPTPMQLWTERKEEFLALSTWFLCGIYLHSRIFFAWRNQRSAVLYFIGLVIIMIGQLSNSFLQFSTPIH